MKRIDYEKLKVSVLKYLYQHRSDLGLSHRNQSKMTTNFGMSIHSLTNVLYELKGMGCVERHRVGNATIWAINEEGIILIGVENKINKNGDENEN